MRRTTNTDRESNLREAIGEALREARAAAGLTQGALQARMASALDVQALSPMMISRVERGERALSLAEMDVLCELLGGGPGAFLQALRQALTPPRRTKKGPGAAW